MTDGVVSRDLHEVVVEDPETRPGSGITDAVDAGAVPIEVTVQTADSVLAGGLGFVQNDVPSPRGNSEQVAPDSALVESESRSALRSMGKRKSRLRGIICVAIPRCGASEIGAGPGSNNRRSAFFLAEKQLFSSHA